MLSQIKMKKNKRGVSIMIGYVLLVSLAVVMGLIAYQWMKTYLPSDIIECPDGASLFVKEYTCDANTRTFNVTLKNNGRFDVAGYYIRVADIGETKPTIEIYQNLSSDPLMPGLNNATGAIIYELGNNSLKPGQEKYNSFLLNKETLNLVSLDITPVRWQVDNNRNKFVVCTQSTVREILTNCKLYIQEDDSSTT